VQPEKNRANISPNCFTLYEAGKIKPRVSETFPELERWHEAIAQIGQPRSGREAGGSPSDMQARPLLMAGARVTILKPYSAVRNGNMTTFDKRENAFEERFAHDAELQFKITARRNKLVGQWAAEKWA
jgi:hypothetical protein